MRMHGVLAWGSTAAAATTAHARAAQGLGAHHASRRLSAPHAGACDPLSCCSSRRGRVGLLWCARCLRARARARAGWRALTACASRKCCSWRARWRSLMQATRALSWCRPAQTDASLQCRGHAWAEAAAATQRAASMPQAANASRSATELCVTDEQSKARNVRHWHGWVAAGPSCWPCWFFKSYAGCRCASMVVSGFSTGGDAM